MLGGALVLSIRSPHAESILAGKKTVELRRVKPRLSDGDWVLVYVPTPRKELIGAFEVEGVLEGAPALLWEAVNAGAAVPRETFDEYYAGAVVAYGILIRRAVRFAQTLPLSSLRTRLPGFRAPQSYRYLDRSEVREIGALDLLPRHGV